MELIKVLINDQAVCVGSVFLRGMFYLKKRACQIQNDQCFCKEYFVKLQSMKIDILP